MKAFLMLLLLKTNQYKTNTIGRNNKNSKELKSIFVVDKVWIITFFVMKKIKDAITRQRPLQRKCILF